MTQPLPAPTPNVETQGFWDAANEGRFLVPRCEDCGKEHWYPRAVCPFCHGAGRLEPSEGRGEIYSYSVTRGETPYVIAYVKLSEGPTLLTNIVNCEFANVAIGAAVRVKFVASTSGQNVPVFVLAEGEDQ